MVNGRKVIALCISRLHDIENSRFVEELSRKLTDCSLWVYNITADLYWLDDDLRAETSVFDLLDFSRTDAVIYMDEKIKSKVIAGRIISRAKQANVPVIVVDGSYEGCISVRYDYQKGFASVVRHVIEEHHAKRLHFIGGMPDNPFSEERLAVFREELEAHGLPFDDSMVSYGHFWAKPAKAAAEALVARGDLPDAVICANDIMAINVSNVLQEHGYSVPEDVIVTGFDGIDEIYFAKPSLTSVRCASSGMAKSVMYAISEVLDAGKTHESCYLAEPELIVNDSCGCIHAGEKNVSDHLFSFNDRFYRYQDDARALSAMSEKMQMCGTIQEAGWCMYQPYLHDMCCIIDKRCADHVINMLEDNTASGDNLMLFFDNVPDFWQRSFDRSEVIPDLEKVVAEGYPLIFNVIDFMNVPLGYICFHFKEYEITDYCSIPMILTAISTGLGGFINMQHQKYLRSQIENMYKYDSLTGLYTRLSFGKAFDDFREAHAGESLALTVMLADLDGLKIINDQFGHSAGDQAIAAVAEALRQACPPQALCVRFGGDEMVAVIPGECRPEEITAQIKEGLDAFNRRSGLPFTVSASVGVHSAALTDAPELERLIEAADAGMYAEKQNKKAEPL